MYMNNFRRFIVLIGLTLTILAGSFTSPVFAQPAQQEAPKASSASGQAMATEDWVDINFSSPDAHIDPHIDQQNRGQNDHWKLFIGDRVYPCITKGNPQTPPVLVAGEGIGGGKALRIELGAVQGPGPDNGRDKINYAVFSGHDAYAPGLGDGRMRYYSFAVRLDSQAFMTPTTGQHYIVAQWWQGTIGAPPLALTILPAAHPEENPEIAFAIRNQSTGATPSAQTIMLPPKYTTRLERGRWYRFVVGASFGFSDDAEIKVWIDDLHKQEISWRGSIGYDPASSGYMLGYIASLLQQLEAANRELQRHRDI